MRRLCLAPLIALVLTVPVLAAGSVSAVAADGPDPCKVVKTSEIAKAFGGAEVSKGKKGLSTAVNTQCAYTVGATADFPEGDVVIHVMFVNGNVAFDGLKKETSVYVPTTGLSKSIYNARESVVNTLKGKVLLGAQGLFTDGTLPITYEDVESQLVEISKAGLKRV